MPNEPERPERKAAGLAYASLILVLGLLLGVVIRLWLAKAGEGQSFSDNAVVALMAMRALRGKFYTFYWGQSYMGSLEAIVVAPFFAVLGANDFALSVGLLPWYVVFAAVLYAVTELCGGAVPATIALALAALAPADVQYYQITARGGYPAVSRPSSRQPPLKAAARIPPGMSVTLILLSSLGLWAAIWAAVSSLLSHWF